LYLHSWRIAPCQVLAGFDTRHDTPPFKSRHHPNSHIALPRVQRCWVHKTANVLNAMPKSLQSKAKAHLKDIWMAETKAKADAAFDFFVKLSA